MPTLKLMLKRINAEVVLFDKTLLNVFNDFISRRTKIFTKSGFPLRTGDTIRKLVNLLTL